MTARAEEILKALEQKDAASAVAEIPDANTQEMPPAEGMASLFADGTLAELRTLDIMTMTPLEAMNTLYRLQEQARKEAGQA